MAMDLAHEDQLSGPQCGGHLLTVALHPVNLVADR
jgi:hypothetical protein